MKSGCRTFLPVMLAVLIVTVGHVLQASEMGRDLVAVAAASPNTGGQGVSGRPQKNGAITGSPKTNPSINGSHIRGKR